MTVREALMMASKRLADGGVSTPWLDVWVLLSDILGTDREHLFAAYSDHIDPETVRRLSDAVDQRLSGRPVSYIIGRKEFYGLTFVVDERVLVPRPDTETLVDAVLDVVDREAWIVTVHDCCTGSGCIAIAVAHERPYLSVSASDVSADALEVAAVNSERLLGRTLSLIESDLLSNVEGRFHMITANPPYLTDSEYETMKTGGWPEPALALAAGPDGLSAYRRLIPAAVDSLCKGGYLFVETADNQTEMVRALLRENGFQGIDTASDLGGRRRVSWGRTAG